MILTVNLSLNWLKRKIVWDLLTGFTTFFTLLINFIGLLNGITVALPHLLYIPVVIAAYRYPKRGLIISGCIGAIYFLMVILTAEGSASTLVEALVRTLVIIGIGWLIAVLSFRLREREELYQGLFYHSEAGSILIRNTDHGRVIEEANDKASELLHKAASDLTGQPLTSFMSGESEEDMFSQSEGKGHSMQ